MSLLELFCHVDDFWQSYAPHWEQELLHSGIKQRRRAGNPHPSEIMTILIFFHQMRYRDFKVTEKFVTEKHRAMLLTSGQPDQLLDLILNYQPTYRPKWVDRSEV